MPLSVRSMDDITRPFDFRKEFNYKIANNPVCNNCQHCDIYYKDEEIDTVICNEMRAREKDGVSDFRTTLGHICDLWKRM